MEAELLVGKLGGRFRKWSGNGPRGSWFSPSAPMGASVSTYVETEMSGCRWKGVKGMARVIAFTKGVWVVHMAGTGISENVDWA